MLSPEPIKLGGPHPGKEGENYKAKQLDTLANRDLQDQYLLCWRPNLDGCPFDDCPVHAGGWICCAQPFPNPKIEESRDVASGDISTASIPNTHSAFAVCMRCQQPFLNFHRGDPAHRTMPKIIGEFLELASVFVHSPRPVVPDGLPIDEEELKYFSYRPVWNAVTMLDSEQDGLLYSEPGAFKQRSNGVIRGL